MSYYDLDDIFADEFPVTAYCKEGMDGLFPDQEEYTNQAIKDKTVVVPLWLALGISTRNYLAIRTPGFLTKDSLNSYSTELAQQSESSSSQSVIDIDMKSKSREHFYEVAYSFIYYYGVLKRSDQKELSTTILKWVYTRFRNTILPFSSSRGDTNIDLGYYSRLAELEKKLYRTQERSARRFHEWRNNKTATIPVDPIINKIYKRQRYNNGTSSRK